MRVDPHTVNVVVNHPRITDLCEDPDQQRRAESFAVDLARWMLGRPREELNPLARVVTVVAHRELRDTRRLCHGRPLLAVEAAARAAQALWPLLHEPSPPEEEEEEGSSPPQTPEGEEDTEESLLSTLQSVSGADLSGEEDPELDALIEQLVRRLDGPPDTASVGEASAQVLQEVTQAAAEGALETDRVAQHLERFLPGVGWSHAPGQLELTLLERLDQLAKLLTQLQALRDLADALGRLEEATRERGPREGGREEVVGVRFGGDVSTALPCELGLLADPGTEDLFYQRLVEQRLVSLELSGSGDEGAAQGDKRGPIIGCIDTSASMEGAPELAAKALVLAVCRSAIPRGRAVHLVLFGGPGEHTEIHLKRGLGGLKGLLDFLQSSFHSGTDFDGPLLRAMDLLEEQELHLADVLVVTDGLGRAAPHVVERVQELRERRGVRVWSVVFSAHPPRGVEPFSDHVLQVEPGQAAEAAGVVRDLGWRSR